MEIEPTHPSGIPGKSGGVEYLASSEPAENPLNVRTSLTIFYFLTLYCKKDENEIDLMYTFLIRPSCFCKSFKLFSHFF